MSHCERVSNGEIEAMAQAGVVAVLLPTTAYQLRLDPPPARTLIKKGVFINLFNPMVLYYFITTCKCALYALHVCFSGVRCCSRPGK